MKKNVTTLVLVLLSALLAFSAVAEGAMEEAWVINEDPAEETVSEVNSLVADGAADDAPAKEAEPAAPEAGEEDVEEDAQANASDVAIDSAHFPDKTFRSYVSKNFDKNKDGKLSSAEIKEVKDIQLDDRDFSSLKGIEAFVELKRLYFYDCYGWSGEVSLDLGKNTKLETLVCACTPLHALDIRKNKNLKVLDCEDCGLKTLDVSNNKKLEKLNCEENSFTRLDISKCPHLVKCVKKGKKSPDGRGYTYKSGGYSLSVDESVKLYTDAVKKVEITNGSKATMQVGEKLTLKAKFSPSSAYSTLTWKSSDEKVATVSSSGVVTAKKKGTAKITVKTANGKKDSIKITVKGLSNKEIHALYKKKIKKIKDIEEFEKIKYIDLTGDGLDEAIVVGHSVYGYDEISVYVFTCKDRAVKTMLEEVAYGLGITLYKKTKALLGDTAGHGIQSEHLWKLEGDKYRYVAARYRETVAAGGDYDGPWEYYDGNNNEISEKRYNEIRNELVKGDATRIY